MRHDNLSRTRSLGGSRRDDLLGPPAWSLGVPKVFSRKGVGYYTVFRTKGLDIIQYFPPKARYFLVIPLEDCRGNIVGPDGAEERGMKQEGRAGAEHNL